MGVPAFFKWLSSKYPSIVSHCVEQRGSINADGTREKVDVTEPNPNDVEFDNFYLDMNGIIHPCTHPENKAAPKTEAEMFVAIFEYIDRLFAIIRPRKVLYMAIDGVAPRAKMNQQRSRRFRAAKEAMEKRLTIERLRNELVARGANLPEASSEHFDSNCITPGTPFMARLAVALKSYIYDRLTHHPGWKNLLIFLSDANVPGEGEHKIMDFIRRQRNLPSHNPNTKHCLCGADADLIMLGLATHEPYFTIIREEFKPNQPKPCELCGQFGHEMQDCVGSPKEEDDQDRPPPLPSTDEFIFIHLDVLRQYLAEDLKLPGIHFEWDLERVIDDWVFMCFFVGNDFLPHLPSLEIREGAIDRLIEIYKSTVQHTDGWLTQDGQVFMDRAQLILNDLGKMEDDIFKNRRDSELAYRRRRKQQQQQNSASDSGFKPQRAWQRPSFESNPPSTGFMKPVQISQMSSITQVNGRYQGAKVSIEEVQSARRNQPNYQGNVNWVDRNLNNLEAATALRAMLKRPNTSTPNPSEVVDEKKTRLLSDPGSPSSTLSRSSSSLEVVDEDEATDAADEIRFWEEGWRFRYYKSKFGIDSENALSFSVTVGQEYAKGLCWVLAYYYQGCVSWDWYFPYHYAPFASDFTQIANVNPGFNLVQTKPFRPLEQLMSVFPADSRSHVPPAWQDLMTDPESPIIDFYPIDFKIDLNGKRFLWMGVALLPFVDEVRLLKALRERESLLTEEELARNVRGCDRLFCRIDHEFGIFLDSVNSDKKTELSLDSKSATTVDTRLTSGLSGKVWKDELAYCPGSNIPSPCPDMIDDLIESKAISVCFSDPVYPSGYVFPARLLDKVRLPPPVLLKPPERGRGRGRGRGGYQGGGENGFNSANRFNSSSGHYGNRGNMNETGMLSPMHRMIRGSLPNRYPSHNSTGGYNSRGNNNNNNNNNYNNYYNNSSSTNNSDRYAPPQVRNTNYGRFMNHNHHQQPQQLQYSRGSPARPLRSRFTTSQSNVGFQPRSLNNNNNPNRFRY